ncbi:MAG: hypothetical protein SGARI_004869, partial [Bacillariaceae sp.]
MPGQNNIGGKGNTFEGGQKVATVFWWPGTISESTINPVVASGLDLLPTMVSLAGSQLNDDIVYDGRDLSQDIIGTSPNPSDDPTGDFVYWCGSSAMAVRTGQYKVMWKIQEFFDGADMKNGLVPPPETSCAGTAQCCPDSPGHLCMCDIKTEFHLESPLVIDLSQNPQEDLSQYLNNNDSTTQAIIATATQILQDRVISEAEDHGGIDVDSNDFNTTWYQLSKANTYTIVDV